MKLFRSALLLTLTLLAASRAQAQELTWQEWSPKVFEQAQKEKKLVLLDVEAVWCHWCHVMHETTYKNKEVQALIQEHFITTRADQDANPDISMRYRDYGWPATVFFAADGTEITKKRGYLEPELMTTLLGKIIKDPSPRHPGEESFAPAEKSSLAPHEREEILTSYLYLYDKQHGGWGDIHRFIDADVMEYTLRRAEAGHRVYKTLGRQTLDGALNLIDPVWGGMYQYSDELDWKSPHFEKIMQVQHAAIENYARGYLLFDKPEYRKGAFDVVRYLSDFMTGPEGAFYTSQDADLSKTVDGHHFYPLRDKERRRLGMPRIDKNLYAAENGMLVSALLTLYEATAEKDLLTRAENAARWVGEHRIRPDGGLSHGADMEKGPFLSDNLWMAHAYLALYEATATRSWLKKAQELAAYMAKNFHDKDGGGFVNSPASANPTLKPRKDTGENILATRFYNLLSHYTGSKEYRELAESGMRYLASPALVKSATFEPGILLADAEVNQPPLHLTIIGGKADGKAAALYRAALAVPYGYKRVEWWDRKEGSMPNPDVEYPETESPAAFVCTNTTCSLPIYESGEILPEIKRSLEETP